MNTWIVFGILDIDCGTEPYSSNAVCDLVWYAATAVRDHLAAEKKEAN